MIISGRTSKSLKLIILAGLRQLVNLPCNSIFNFFFRNFVVPHLGTLTSILIDPVEGCEDFTIDQGFRVFAEFSGQALFDLTDFFLCVTVLAPPIIYLTHNLKYLSR